jgi:MoxR-vWA-beta-propeller ternary system domain bpX2
MSTAWKEVRCASIRADDLPALADLRRHPQIRLTIVRDRAWIHWEHNSDQMRELVVRRILPLPGAQLLCEREGNWYRLGAHLPEFDSPAGTAAESTALHQVLLPMPIVGCKPDSTRSQQAQIGVVRDTRGQARHATALRCALKTLRAWVDRATSAQLAALEAAWTTGTASRTDDAEVLMLGSTKALPLLPSSVRFWGTDLLIPLGFRAEPDLPAPVLRAASRAGPDALLVLDQDGFEAVPRDAFRRLERAGVRLACDQQQGGRRQERGAR